MLTVTQLILLLLIGLVSGLLAGVLGVGGAIIVIPALVFILGMSQHQAQGTSLAFMVPPIGILATWNYWKAGYVNWKFALVLAITFMAGAYLGSLFSLQIPDKVLRKIFGVLLFVAAAKMFFSK